MTLVLVTGSRTWIDRRTVRCALEHCDRTMRRPITLLHGDAPQGLDRMAAELAEGMGWTVEACAADWRVKPDTPPWAIRARADGVSYDVMAGLERNERMLDRGPDLVLAFNRGGSPGTTECVAGARRRGIRTVSYRTDERGRGCTMRDLAGAGQAQREGPPTLERRGPDTTGEEGRVTDDSKACSACGAPLIWALSATGRPSPITREPKAGGNALVFQRDGEVRWVACAPGIAAWLSSAGVPLRLNHFADCPQADRFRRPPDPSPEAA